MAAASDKSELLVAKGQVAFHKGQYDEALGLLDQAVAADAEDAEAHYMRGLVLNTFERWDEAIAAFDRAIALRPDYPAAQRGLMVAQAGQQGLPPPITAEVERAAPIDEVTRARRPAAFKRWEVHASTAAEYDSNVTLAGDTPLAPKQGDAGIIVGVGGRYDLVSEPEQLFRVEYDFYQNWHPNVREFDFQSHRPRATGSFGVWRNTWVGVQGGMDYYRLGDESYLGEGYVLPFASYDHEGLGLTQVTFRWADGTYYAPPFENLRDGQTIRVGASHTFYRAGGKYLTLGYAYGQESPNEEFFREPATVTGPSTCRRNSSSGDTAPCPRDFELFYNEVSVTAGMPGWGETLIDVGYSYTYYAYDQPNSLAGFRKGRYDNGHLIFAQVLRPITRHLRVALAYFGTFNPSNLDIYDYTKHVIQGRLEVVY